MSTPSRRLSSFFWLALLGGCADGPGHGFATLESAELRARFEPGVARDAGGAVLTDLGYQLELSRLEIDLERLALEAAGGDSSGFDFDPASPPPGYTFCHAGHCHAEDGLLVDYEEVELELGGQARRFVAVRTLPIERAVDALAAESLALEHVEPSRELPETELRRVRLELRTLRAEGSVRGGALAAQVPLAVELVASGALTALAELGVDRSGPARIDLRVALKLRGTLFDGVDFAALETAGAIAVTDVEAQAGQTLFGALLESELAVDYEGESL